MGGPVDRRSAGGSAGPPSETTVIDAMAPAAARTSPRAVTLRPRLWLPSDAALRCLDAPSGHCLASMAPDCALGRRSPRGFARSIDTWQRRIHGAPTGSPAPTAPGTRCYLVCCTPHSRGGRLIRRAPSYRARGPPPLRSRGGRLARLPRLSSRGRAGQGRQGQADRQAVADAPQLRLVYQVDWSGRRRL